MSSDNIELGSEQLRGLFEELSESLRARDLQAQLFVVGGAAMALAYDDRRMTRDVDAVFVPAREVREIAAEVGQRHDLDPDWLNDAAKGFMPAVEDTPQTVYESESLVVQVPSAEFLLAMKLHASRADRDLDDAAVLFVKAGYRTPEHGMDLLARSYPPSRLLPKHTYAVAEVAQRAAALRATQQEAAGQEQALRARRPALQVIRETIRQIEQRNDLTGDQPRHRGPEPEIRGRDELGREL